MKTIQHQNRQTFPAQPSTPTAAIVGISWMVPWEPPQFKKEAKAYLAQTEFSQLIPSTVPAGISGSAWFKPWEPPLFPLAMKSNLQSTEFVTLVSTTLPPMVAGIAFWYPFDQPAQVHTKPEIQQTEARVLIPSTVPAGIAGIAWMRGWEPPYFPKRVEAKFQQTELFALSPATLPVKVSGNAWRRAWELPYYKRFPSHLQQTQLVSLTIPFTIAPPYFWYPFDQPKQVRVSVEIQMTTIQTIRPSPKAFARGYIIGPA